MTDTRSTPAVTPARKAEKAEVRNMAVESLDAAGTNLLAKIMEYSSDTNKAELAIDLAKKPEVPAAEAENPPPAPESAGSPDEDVVTH